MAIAGGRWTMLLVAFSDTNLDNNAQELYRQFGGIDKEYSDLKIAKTHKALSDEEAKTDQQRLLMAELAHLLSSYLADNRFLEGVKTQKNSVAELLKTLETLSVFPGHNGGVLIRYRGFPTGTGISADTDYVVEIGTLSLDAVTAAAMLNRMGLKISHLSGRLNKSFKIFSEHGISTLYLKLPKTKFSAEESESLHNSLRIICQYNQALKKNTNITFEKNSKKTILPIAKDEKGHPDINLTLLAGINALNTRMMTDMVQKVGNFLKQNESLPFVSVYDAVFSFKSLREKLLKPLIEINNIRWLSLDRNHTVISKEKAKLSRMVSEHFKSSPQNTAQVMQTVYGHDYQQISSENFGERLKIATNLLETVNAGEKDIEKEILSNIGENFGDVRDEVFEDVIIQKNILKVRSGEKETVVGKIHSRLQGLINFYKGRAEANRKMKNIAHRSINFNDRDYENIAEDFDVSVESAKELISLLKSCFNAEGRFLRSVFERHIPEFARYEDKVFKFLWHYLKETPNRNDRVAFLNSLQLLIGRMKKPDHALEMLLTDIFKTPSEALFSDRNAFILCNMLIRMYNKEMNVDTELTPEEVLLVRRGLNLALIKDVAARFEADREYLFEKIRAIYSGLINALEGNRDKMSVRFLLYLEREIHIFLAMIGGNSARAILRSAVKRYGNPDSEIYILPESRIYSEMFMQHLTVAIRGLERVGDAQDMRLIEEIRKNLKRFSLISRQPRYVSKLNRMTECLDKAEKHINAGVWQEFAQAA